MSKQSNEYNLEEYKQHGWVNVSKGNWSFLSCTDFISCYTRDLTIEGMNPFNHPVQVCIGEKSELWFLKDELDAFGSRIKHINTPEAIDTLLENVRRSGDEALSFIRNSQPEDFDANQYRKLWQKIREYYQYHLVVKYLGEYLSQDDLDKFSSRLKDARVAYGEPIFNESEKLARRIIELISEKSGVTKELAAYLTRDELEDYLKTSSLPTVSELEKRYKKSLIIGTTDSYAFVTDGDANLIESFLYHTDNKDTEEILGNSAFKGSAKGTARVILDPHSDYVFNEGDILVTGMTHVDYISIVKKSSGIVTDAGGILSHAAIIARELQKPCVIGTKNATKLIKDGDQVYVDADVGVVTILKD